ncbi:MAG: GNAT family N-acetyltransferase [Ahrensia sp.]|nr:GNAT family N-acetyltransferase [Ahrensia sp.]
MTDIVIRPASEAEFSTAVEWAAGEGWNPGLDDLSAFFAADPDGFLMGFVEDEPVSSISVVRYGADFGFLGFYIVRPDYRGSGAGMAIWNAGMRHLDGRTVGLDGVVAQQDNYRKSGFILSGRNIRHTGVPLRMAGSAIGCEIRSVRPSDIEAMIAYDRSNFPVDRSAFVADWTLPPDGVRRQSRVAVKDGAIFGYGTIRTCRAGYKIGPLFADDPEIAEALFAALVDTMPSDAEVSLDTPEDNVAAVAIAVRAGLAPVFETARMYRGADPKLPIHRIFGITTFELG